MKRLSEDLEDEETSLTWKCLLLAFTALKRIPGTVYPGDYQQSMLTQLTYVEKCLETAQIASHFEFMDDDEDED